MDEYGAGMRPSDPRPAPAPWRAARTRVPFSNLALFVLTVASTVLAGAYLAHFDADFLRFWVEFKHHPHIWVDGLPFAVTLMAILLSHELGHYLLARHHQVRCTLPYFLPGPNLVGTFGAVILMKSAIPNRRALFDIGAAGPLAGLAAAIFAMAVGLATAEVSWFNPGDFPQGAVMFHYNLLLLAMSKLWPLAPPAAPVALALHPELTAEINTTVITSPLLDAACVGFLVTMLNLVPVGQLDGGHIAYAVLGRRSKWLSVAALAGIVVLGSFYWLPWLFLAVLLAVIMGRRGFVHPPPLDPLPALGPGRKILAALILILFILIVSPNPVDVYLF